MSILVWAFIVLTVAATSGLLVAVRLDSRWGRWLAKLLASLGFLGVALSAGAWASPYGRVVLLALVLCWWGDVLLLPRGGPWFLWGLVSFLLGHLAFGAAFLVVGVALPWVVLALVVEGVLGVVVLCWLWPHVPRRMRPPVAGYVVIISLMLALAVGMGGDGGSWIVPLAALSFYLSDIAVARQRFVTEAFANRAVGLPLYYGAQVVLALSVAWVG